MGRFVLAGTIVYAACGRIGFDEGVTPGVGEQARASFSVGVGTACAIRSGDVYCWGHGGEGQLGDGEDTSVPALVPQKVAGLPKATQVGVARYHACVLTVDATVWCWGGDEHGRLGNLVPGGPPTDPAIVPLPARATEISVTYDNTCAVLETGAVWCWGLDQHGQLGRATTGPDDMGRAPGAVTNLDDAVHVSVDDDSACAIRSSGQVVCWGENGRQMIDTSGTDVTTPRAVAGLDGAIAVAVGGDTVCALIDGRIGCRGHNFEGQLGNGEQDDSATVVFSALDDYVTLESHFTHTCAVRETGNVMCWGGNDNGVLGDGTIDERHAPVRVVNLDDALAVSTDQNATCALRADDRLTCWGWGARGLLADGRSAVLSAEMVPTVAGATSLAVGRDHTCASNGLQVLCWGSNRVGQLGFGSPSGVMATPQVVNFSWPSGIAQLVAGEAHTCARLNNNSVYCWGDNRLGQLGDGTRTNRATPTLVSLPMPTTAIASGLLHACAIGTDNALRCWGYNLLGQIGDGTTTDRETPVSVANNITQVVAGDMHTCARSGGAMTCWGDNGGGQIGDGSTTMMQTQPTAVPGLVVANIAAGGASTCAEDTNSNVRCWGLNQSGVLNIPSAPYLVPTPMMSAQGELFSIGGSTACIGNTCWGENGLGQVGAGAFLYYADPTVVMNLPSAAAANSVHAVSATHACAIVDDSRSNVWCWGENANGEIGNGSVSTSLFPSTTAAFP